LTAVLASGTLVQGRPGGAMMIFLLGLIPVPFLPRDGTAWPLAVGAPALGLIGLGGAWPALAARAGGVWRRGALGALGWVWLALAGAISGSGLYLKQPAGIAPLPIWSGSLHQTVQLMLQPIASAGVLAAAPVWALASMTLPWLVRGRSLALDFVLVCTWAAAVVGATTASIALVHPGASLLPSGTAIAGALAGGLIALAPTVRRAARGRA
jgi:eukaryotic-like serine/threonine-protein kinase